MVWKTHKDPTGHENWKVRDPNLPDWHKWEVEWGNGQMKVYLDGRHFGTTAVFNGTPDRVWLGGLENGLLPFDGKWRNLKINGAVQAESRTLNSSLDSVIGGN